MAWAWFSVGRSAFPANYSGPFLRFNRHPLRSTGCPPLNPARGKEVKTQGVSVLATRNPMLSCREPVVRGKR